MPKLLVIKPSSLGDIIHALQVVQAFKNANSDWKVSWVAREIFAPLVRASNTVDHVYTFERKGGIPAFLRLIRQLRKEKWDSVWDMQGLARSGLLTFAVRSPIKIGRSDAREGASFAYSQKVPLPDSPHAVDILAAFLETTDRSAPLPDKLSFKDPEKKTSPLPSPYILLFPESRRPEKVWPNFNELASRILSTDDRTNIVWAGSNSDGAPNLDSPRFFNLAGKTSIDELPALISNATLVVTNDSGPMHLAAALDIPTLALFGPTRPEQYGPYPPNRPSNRCIRANDANIASIACDEVLECIKSLL